MRRASPDFLFVAFAMGSLPIGVLVRGRLERDLATQGSIDVGRRNDILLREGCASTVTCLPWRKYGMR
jgi:hypothetical protein